MARLGARAGAASTSARLRESTATPFQAGVASWYGPGFDGRPTASGEIFRADSLTAAHRELPFGTRVRVVDVESGREVVVRINDRGPFAGDRIIDLSRAAAERLEIVDAGLADVVLFVIQQAGDGGGTTSGPDAATRANASTPHSIASSR